MSNEVIDSIINTMVDKLLDVCNRNQLNPQEACSCIMTAICSTLYSIFRSMGMNDRKQIREKICMVLQRVIDAQDRISSIY